MNKEERVVKYINSADELIFNGKRYCENDFYNDVEDLAKENQELKEVIDKAIEYIDDWLFNVGGMGACMDYKDIKEILDILKVGENE